MKTNLVSLIVFYLLAIRIGWSQTIINSFPYVEDFESYNVCSTTPCSACALTGDWVNVSYDDFDWTVYYQQTKTILTGPTWDYLPGTSASGIFLYTESSGFSCWNDTAMIESPLFDLTGLSNFRMTFGYHMYGWNMNNARLHVDVAINNGTTWIKDIIPTFTDNLDQWQEKNIDLSSYVGDTIKIRIRGVLGAGEQSDIAIDGFRFFALENNDAGITHVVWDKPISPGVQDVKVVVKNFGHDTLRNMMIGWSVDRVLQSPFAWNGLLPTYATDSQVVPGMHNFSGGTTDLKVWSYNPNGISDDDVSNDTISLTLCTGYSGRITIGGPSADFQTFGDAIESLAYCGVIGPVELFVKPGTDPYNEQFIIPSIPGTSVSNTVTISGNGQVLTFEPTEDSLYVIRLDEAKHIIIDSLTIISTNPSVGYGIHFIHGADSNTIQNCRVEMQAVNSNSACIASSESETSLEGDGWNGKHLTLYNNDLSGAWTGIKLSYEETSTAAYHSIMNNYVHHFQYEGIVLTHSSWCNISNNTVILDSVTSPFCGICIGTQNDYITVEANRVISHHGGTGIGLSSGAGFLHNSVVNNIITSKTGKGIGCGSPSTDIIHNTIVVEDGRGITLDESAVVMNNIIKINNTGTCIEMTYFRPAILKSNVYFIDTLKANIGYLEMVYYPTLNRWQNNPWAGMAIFDDQSIFADPIFTNIQIRDFLPTNPLIDNTGDSTKSAPVDFYNANRSKSYPDPGAVEFNACNKYTLTDAFFCSTNSILSGLGNHSGSGIYTDTFLAANNCDSVLVTSYTVYAPDTSITVSGMTLTANVQNASYQWIDCNDNTPVMNEVGQSFIVTDPGSYAVIVNKDGCSDTSSCYQLLGVGTGDLYKDPLTIFPNPTSGRLTLLGLSTSSGQLVVTNILGETLRSIAFKNQDQLQLDISDLLPGIYFLSIYAGESIQNIKVLKD